MKCCRFFIISTSCLCSTGSHDISACFSLSTIVTIAGVYVKCQGFIVCVNCMVLLPFLTGSGELHHGKQYSACFVNCVVPCAVGDTVKCSTTHFVVCFKGILKKVQQGCMCMDRNRAVCIVMLGHHNIELAQ